MVPESMIPVCLVTGFLGVGKTTLLARLVAQMHGRRVVYLVNEFSPTDVDGARLDLPEGALVSVAGGSIFCRCKAGDFITALERIRERKPEGVVIETSGIADPTVMQTLLDETGLETTFALTQIICVVDPGNISKLLITLPAVGAQIRAADRILINKSDCYEAEAIARCEAQVRVINPTAQCQACQHCAVDFDCFAHHSGALLVGEFAQCADPRFARVDADLPEQVDLASLRALLDEARAILYRAKGAVPTASGARDIDWTIAGWNDSACATAGRQLVLIGDGAQAAAIDQLARRIRSLNQDAR